MVGLAARGAGPRRKRPTRAVFDVAVVGSGFAGSILARGLAAAGRSVLLVERGRHPRFALGESSTPLAAIALERLAARLRKHGDDGGDLAALAAAGRWRRRLDPPAGDRLLRRGLKRGFSFYAHTPDRPYANSADNDARLLVAASPDAEIADSHWLRADVDHHLARRAVAAGATLWEGCELAGVEIPGGADGDGAVRLTGCRRRDDSDTPEPVEVEVGFVVDASGPGGFLARHLPLAESDPGTPDTALLFGHFRGVGRFADAARAAGAQLSDGPYPDDRAAVHHFLAEGWAYVLRFDPEDGDGRALASAGLVLRREAARDLAHLAPADAFDAVLSRYPTLAATFAGTEPARQVGRIERLPHRLARTHGRRWLLLPHAHAFFDPLFSTGMAWSLVGVERALDLLAGEKCGLAGDGETPGAGSGRFRPPDAAGLERYGSLLAAEADHVAHLVAGAWAAMGTSLAGFRLAAAHAQLYFAAASFTEARQRLVASDTPGGHAWDGFFGATDPLLAAVVARAHRRLVDLRADPAGADATGPSPADVARFESWVADAVAPRNLAGLADPSRRNLYPVDLDALVAHADLLGLTRRQMVDALPRLRGAG